MTKIADKKSAAPLRKAGYHHGDLRAGLIEATRRLVEENGPDGFSVSDACRLAGVSTAAPYKHFKNKDEMLIAVVMGGIERLKANMYAALEGIPERSPMRIKAVGEEYVNFALKEPAVFRLKFGGFTDGMDDEALREAGEGIFHIALTEVAACIDAPIESEVARTRTFMLWSFVHGLSFILYDKDLKEMGGGADLEFLLADVARRVLS